MMVLLKTPLALSAWTMASTASSTDCRHSSWLCRKASVVCWSVCVQVIDCTQAGLSEASGSA